MSVPPPHKIPWLALSRTLQGLTQEIPLLIMYKVSELGTEYTTFLGK